MLLLGRVCLTSMVAGVMLMSAQVQADFLPPNDLHKFDQLNAKTATITKKEFNAIIERAEKFYAPIVEEHGAQLNIVGRWDDSTVNAGAGQFFFFWMVNMFGGLARRPEITPDGFALVLCHEIGHHLGGFVFKKGVGASWAANEGQADYFATQSCARQLWRNDDAENALAKATVHPVPKAACDGVWATEKEQNLCYRVANAAKSLADLMAALRQTQIGFDTPDLAEVEESFDDHPAAQCRLDTYLSGALCAQEFDVNVIPGKEGEGGRNDLAAEHDSGLQTCMAKNNFAVGVRPRCWFAPIKEEGEESSLLRVAVE